MRLGQLARKLSLRPGEIVEFLNSKGYSIGEDSNARLEDDHVQVIIKQYAPEMLDDILETVREVNPEPVVSEPATQEEPPAESEDTLVTESLVVVGEIEVQPEEVVEENILKEENQQPVDIIKAPKVELPGLKVVGKIDLPEPKKKEPIQPVDPESATTEQQEEEQQETFERKDRVRGRDQRKRRNERRQDKPRKNSVVLKREREAREAETKKQDEKIQEKERRTKNYLKKIKPIGPTKAARLIKEQVVDMQEEFETKTPPRTIWGKFVKWLRRE